MVGKGVTAAWIESASLLIGNCVVFGHLPIIIANTIVHFIRLFLWIYRSI